MSRTYKKGKEFAFKYYKLGKYGITNEEIKFEPKKGDSIKPVF